MTGWFQDLVRAKVEELGSQTKLAEDLGVRVSVVNGWLSGSNAHSMDAIANYIAALGGDIRRALPDYTPASSAEPGSVEGSVTANSCVFSTDDKKRKVPGGLMGYFRESGLYSHTYGKEVFLIVDGSSMAPDYPDGTLLVCRKPTQPTSLPDKTPAIVRIGEGSTFKLIQWVEQKQILLVPINQTDHKILSFKASDVSIDLVVIGRVIPNNYVPPRHHGAPRPTLLRSSKKKTSKEDLPDVKV